MAELPDEVSGGLLPQEQKCGDEDLAKNGSACQRQDSDGRSRSQEMEQEKRGGVSDEFGDESIPFSCSAHPGHPLSSPLSQPWLRTRCAFRARAGPQAMSSCSMWPSRAGSMMSPVCFSLFALILLTKSSFADEYIVITMFEMAVTIVSLLWSFGFLEKPLSQIFAVIFIFTWPFSKLASESGLTCEFHHHDCAPISEIPSVSCSPVERASFHPHFSRICGRQTLQLHTIVFPTVFQLL